MSDSYLRLAEQVLETRGRPMSAQQILADARRFGLMPEHLFGQTMPKTLQARIAEDIFQKRSKSAFYRTSLGTYFLRLFAEDESLPRKARTEFLPHPRAKPYPKARVLFFEHRFDAATTRFLQRDEFQMLGDQESSYYFLEMAPELAIKVLTFSIVTYRDLLLIHKIGKHSHFVDLIGCATVGLRRFIDEYDIDLFSEENIGLDLNSAREVSRVFETTEAKFDDREIRRRLSHFGTIIEPDARRLSIILSVNLTDLPDFSGKIRRRLDMGSPQWLPLGGIDHHNLDEVSRTVLQEVKEL